MSTVLASHPAAPPPPAPPKALTLVEVPTPPATAPAHDLPDDRSGLRCGDAVMGYVTLAPGAPREAAGRPLRAIGATCRSETWRLVDVVTDREAGRGLARPGLTYALRQIAAGQARGLVVAEMRRLCTSAMELGPLLEWFRDADAALVALDLGMDTSSRAGRDLASRLITLGAWERERIARLTRSGMADRHPGRPAVSDRPELAQRITAMRESGMTLQAIADRLNVEGVPTLRGGSMWRPSSVQAALGYRRPGSRSPRDRLPALGMEAHG